MSYYEDRIKELEARIEQMAMGNRLKAIPVEAQLIDRIAELNKENARLNAELARLRASSFVTAVPVEEYERLKAEVERLKAVIESYKDASKRIFAILDEERRLTKHLKAEVERLRKVTDVMSDAIDIYRGWVRLPGDGPFREHLNMIIELMQAKDEWNAAQIAAKEDKPSV